MNTFLIGMGMALWFGILTSISPCPLATNIAAVSYIGRRVDKPLYMLSAGILYTMVRMVTYALLGAFLVSSANSLPFVANFLQKYMNIILGPILIVIGVVLLDFLKINIGGSVPFGGYIQTHVERSGIWGAGLLGIIFALSFCPISAGLFFGSLFSVAITHNSKVIMPLLYGIGTAIPVLAFASFLAFATHLIGKAINSLALFELWARKITAVVFILAGLYISFSYLSIL